MLHWKTPEYILVLAEQDLQELSNEIKSNIEKDIPISIDVETTGCFPTSALDYYHGWLLGVSIACNKNKGYYIPLSHLKHNTKVNYQLNKNLVIDTLNSLLQNKGLYIGHNLKFDYKFLWNSGIKLYPRFWDTSVAIQLINGDTLKPRALKRIITDWVDIPPQIIKTFEDVAGVNAAEVPPEEMAIYAINDVIFTYYLYEALKPIIDESYFDLAYNKEFPLIPILGQIELMGVRLDVDYLKSLLHPLTKYKKQIETFIQNKYNINVGSSKQLGELLENQFSHVMLERSPKGNIVTNEEFLEKMKRTYPAKSEEHKLAKRVLTYRTVDKAINTYVYKYTNICEEQFINGNKTHSIIHTDYDQIKNSGRLGSSNPNLQNIPNTFIVDVRKGFIPRPGYVFVEADWSSAELRLVAIASKEPQMVQAYKQNPRDADLHTLTACNIFNKKEVTPEERSIGKTLNFSILYGGTEFAISRVLRCSKEQAKDYIERFYLSYSGLDQWKKIEEQRISSRNYSETFYGRRRYLPAGVYKNMKDKWKYYGAIRELINHIIQGSCADLLKQALCDITHDFAINNIDAYICNTTHDSIIVETTDPEKTISVLKKNMEIEIDGILMPIDVQVKYSFSKKDSIKTL